MSSINVHLLPIADIQFLAVCLHFVGKRYNVDGNVLCEYF